MNVLSNLARNAARIGAINPIKSAVGGPGSLLELLNTGLRGLGADTPDQPLPTMEDVGKFLQQYLPEGYTEPQGGLESIADLALGGIGAPIKGAKALGLLGKSRKVPFSQVGKAIKSNLGSAAGSSAAEALGGGELSQFAGGLAGGHLANVSGLPKSKSIKGLSEPVRQDLYNKSDAIKTAPSKKSLNALKSNVEKSLVEIEKGIPSKEKLGAQPHIKHALTELQKPGNKIEDIIRLKQDLNNLGYESKLPEVQQKEYRKVVPHFRKAIEEFGNKVPKFNEYFPQAETLTKLIKQDPESKNIASAVAKELGKKSLSIPGAIMDWIIEPTIGKLNENRKLLMASPALRKAFWNVNTSLLAGDKEGVFRSLRQVSKDYRRAEKKESDELNDLIDSYGGEIEFLN